MTYRIWKRFEFSASHVLEGLPKGHQCGRMHGHNYAVEVELADAALDDVGFVRDYGELAAVKRWLDEVFDHRHLNDALPEGLNPTAENLARYIFDVISGRYPQLVAVRVFETSKTGAEYRP